MGGEMAVRTRNLEGHEIGQRECDGFWNATAICQAAGKKWPDYWRLGASQDVIQAIGESTGIPVDSLVEMRSGRGGGTWVHPDVAIDVARWASPKFAAQVMRWVRELLTTGSVSLQPTGTGGSWDKRLVSTLADHNRELRAAFPCGFTVISATVPELLTIETALGEHGIKTGDFDLPDGSLGSRWARRSKELGVEPIGRAPLFLPCRNYTVFPLVYPHSAMGVFNVYVRDVFLPVGLPEYLANKKEFRSAGPVPLGSVAEMACKKLTNRSACLPPRVRRELDAAGGVVRVRAG